MGEREAREQTEKRGGENATGRERKWTSWTLHWRKAHFRIFFFYPGSFSSWPPRLLFIVAPAFAHHPALIWPLPLLFNDCMTYGRHALLRRDASDVQEPDALHSGMRMLSPSVARVAVFLTRVPIRAWLRIAVPIFRARDASEPRYGVCPLSAHGCVAPWKQTVAFARSSMIPRKVSYDCREPRAPSRTQGRIDERANWG